MSKRAPRSSKTRHQRPERSAQLYVLMCPTARPSCRLVQVRWTWAPTSSNRGQSRSSPRQSRRAAPASNRALGIVEDSRVSPNSLGAPRAGGSSGSLCQERSGPEKLASQGSDSDDVPSSRLRLRPRSRLPRSRRDPLRIAAGPRTSALTNIGIICNRGASSDSKLWAGPRSG